MHLRLNFIKKINKKKSEKKERREQSKLANETSNNKKKKKRNAKESLEMKLELRVKFRTQVNRFEMNWSWDGQGTWRWEIRSSHEKKNIVSRLQLASRLVTREKK